jgi:hypothetical protein
MTSADSVGPDRSMVDQARLHRLEQAREDVRTLRALWGVCAQGRTLTVAENEAFSEAFERLQEDAGIVTDDITEMTGVAALEIGGRRMDLFTAATMHNAMDATAFGPSFRVRELGNLESILSRTIGLVRNGYQPIAERRKREPRVNSFEQARDAIVSIIFERRTETAYTGTPYLAHVLKRDLQEVEDDLHLLRDQQFVSLREGDQTWVVHATLTARGIQRAREGYQATQGGPMITQSNTFLAPAGTINVAQSGTGDVFQHVEPPGDLTEIRRLLGDMKQALAAGEIAEDQREEGLVYIEQLVAELQHPKPRPSMLKIPWLGLGRIADGIAVAGSLGAPTTVAALYQQVSPLIAPLLQLAGGS